MCLSLLWNPNKSVDKAVHDKEWGRSFLAMFLGLIFGLGVLNIVNVISTYYSKTQTPLWQGQKLLFLNIYVLVGLLLFYFLIGFFINTVMKTLTGKGSYYAGFTAHAYACLQMKFGLLLISAFFLLSLFLDERTLLTGIVNLLLVKLTLVFGLIALLMYCLLSCSTYWRLLKDLYNTNMMTVLAALLVLSKATLLLGVIIYLFRNKLM